MHMWRSSVFMLLGLIGSMAAPLPLSYAEEPGAMVDGAGFTLYGTESIKGSDAAKVERDPVCDRSKRPKIFKVEPEKSPSKAKISGPKNASTGSPLARQGRPKSNTPSSMNRPSKRPFLTSWPACRSSM